MRPDWLAALAVGAAILFATPATAQEVELTPVTQTRNGAVQGVMKDGVAVFRGLPFAASTAGAGRWRPPSPVQNWEGVRPAQKAGPACPQSVARGNRVAAFGMDEDCLNLSVYSPRLGAEARAPVMVWIHGGNARFGSGSLYDGAALARRGVVVVTINYRLDRLGLFAHPALTAAQPDEPLANYGLMDMAAALDWVQAGIADFGGDAGNVTIFGQSSGGVAVTALMLSPLTEGRFHKAISQSGSVSIDYPRYLSRSTPNSPSLESDGAVMAQALGVDPGKDEAAQLRALPWQTLLDYTDTERANAMTPVIDGRVMTDNPGRMFREGRNHQVPLMIGSTSWEEGVVARFPMPLKAVLRDVDPAEARAVYGDLDDRTLAQTWFADTAFHVPARFMAAEAAAHGQPAFVYRFSYVTPSKRGQQPGANHSDEVPLVFGARVAADSPDREISDLLAGYWTQFARTGDPNGDARPAWPAYEGGTDQVLMLDQPVTAQTRMEADRLEYHQGRYRPFIEAD
jgi:para-nitrobenzyl esterase